MQLCIGTKVHWVHSSSVLHSFYTLLSSQEAVAAYPIRVENWSLPVYA